MTKFVSDVQGALKNPGASSASNLDVNLGSVIADLTALKSQAPTGQQPALQQDIKALGMLQSGGSSGSIDAQVIGLSLGTPPVKNLPNLLGQICS